MLNIIIMDFHLLNQTSKELNYNTLNVTKDVFIFYININTNYILNI
jgi:hypothetical protein